MNELPPPDARLTGRLRKYHSNFYYVETDGVLYECMLRGLIKKEGGSALVGDFVELDRVNVEARTARIVRVLERRNVLSRPKMANADQALIVCALREPDFDFHQTDRYLIHVTLAGLMPVLCVSKSDLAKSPEEIERIRSLYAERLNYAVCFTAVDRPDSLLPILNAAKGRMTVLAGPSGSGKSSLLNALNPALALRVGEISGKIQRGQHTTRHVELLNLSDDLPDALIADTPGFSNLKLDYVLPSQVEGAFPDFAPYRNACAFSDCLHVDEEDCAVLAHRAEIAESRYESYLDMLAEARLYKAEADASSRKEEFGYKELHGKGATALRVLRLQEKNRDLSRRTLKQQVRRLDLEEDESETAPDMTVEEDSSGSV